MADEAHQAVDKMIEEMQKKISKEYKAAVETAQKRLDDHLAAYAKKDAEWAAKVKAGKATKKDWNKWRKDQMMTGKHWEQMKNALAQDYHNANVIARSIVTGYMPEAYALNANYATFEIEKGLNINTSFTLYNREAVERIAKKDPEILPPPGQKMSEKIAANPDIAWQKGQIQSVTLRSILQGDSIPHMAKTISSELGAENYKSAVRYARTAMTGAQNAGRQDAFERAKNLGIDLMKEWVATLDNRTRHYHRVLDGQRVEVEEPFNADGVEIMKPGDPSAPGFMIWNCRCTMVGQLKGFEKDINVKNAKYMQGMTYKEWKEGKETYGGAKQLSQALQASIAAKPDINKTFDGIWYNQSITYKDWDAKKDSIQGKKDYYNAEIPKALAAGDQGKADLLKQKLADVEEFEKNGAKYSQLLKDAEAAKAKVTQLAPPPKVKPGAGPFTPDAYTQDRKDNALWAKSPKEADAALRPRTGEVWKNATKEERAGIHEYTSSYHKFNEPLRGEEYGTNVKKGVGNTDLNAGYANNGNNLNAMTDIISKCSYEHDMWLQRGCGYSGMDEFLKVDMSLLKTGSEDQLKAALLNEERPEYGFMSCGSSKGRGFSGDILMNVYAPKGTKMMYVEPFSTFGMGDGLKWDGDSKQSNFGTELETILQQGSVLRITKVERAYPGATIYLDMEVSDQLPPQRWTP